MQMRRNLGPVLQCEHHLDERRHPAAPFQDGRCCFKAPIAKTGGLSGRWPKTPRPSASTSTESPNLVGGPFRAPRHNRSAPPSTPALASACRIPPPAAPRPFGAVKPVTAPFRIDRRSADLALRDVVPVRLRIRTSRFRTRNPAGPRRGGHVPIGWPRSKVFAAGHCGARRRRSVAKK